jgi:hypothetical protein
MVWRNPGLKKTLPAVRVSNPSRFQLGKQLPLFTFLTKPLDYAIRNLYRFTSVLA